MAFVFRSQKESLFEIKKQETITPNSQTITNQQSQLNGTSYTHSPKKQSQKSPGKLLKGLPSLLKKNQILESYSLSFQKQNTNYEQKNHQSLKLNSKKLKRITQNYFFSSKVPRQIDLIPLKTLNKNLTCTQFTTNLNRINQEKQLCSNHTGLDFLPNKSLIDSSTVTDFRKILKQETTKNMQNQQIIVDCSKQKKGEFRRKCSLPESLEKTTYHTVLKKINQLRQSNHEKSVDNKTEIFMRTLNQANQTSLKRNFTQKKPMKLHKGNLQSSFYKDQESQQSENENQDVYESDLPGPGSYDASLKQKKSFRSKKQKFSKIFVSPLQRFKNDEIKFHEITYVNSSKHQKMSPNHFFFSKTPKNLQIEIRTSSPPPGSYNPRQSIEHDVVKNLLKSSNVPNFNSSMPRFKYAKKELIPGPGYYNIEAIEKAKQQQIINQLSSSYKSQVKRCGNEKNLRQSQQRRQPTDIIGDKQADRVVIHKRQQHFDSSQFFSPPPFFSSVERFPESQIQKCGQYSFLKSEIKNKTQETKNHQPFNSSAKRIIEQKVGEGIGVGSYLVQKDRWNKKSYNLYFH